MSTKQVHADFAKTVAEQVIKMLEEGTAPWITPWKPGFAPVGSMAMPFNGRTGRQYSGGNALHLWGVAQERGYEDNRWMTFKQIQDAGLRLKENSKGHGVKVEYWDFSKVGKPKANEQPTEGEGQDERKRGPSLYLFTVFNGSMIEGMPEAAARQIPDVQWRHAECERLMQESGAAIHHDGGNRAFYRSRADTIHLPVKEAFKTPDGYYATALHELGHWTGHESRLNRDLSGTFGTESYAKEELVAELASMMMGDRLGIGHDPGQHASYIKSWIQALKDDPMEIMRASSRAEAVCRHLGIEAYQHEPMQVVEREKTNEAEGQAKPKRTRRFKAKKTHEAAKQPVAKERARKRDMAMTM